MCAVSSSAPFFEAYAKPDDAARRRCAGGADSDTFLLSSAVLALLVHVGT